MDVAAEVLKEIVQRTKAGISTKGMVPILECLCLDDGIAVTHDDSVTIITECPELAGISAGVPLRPLEQWVSRQKGKTIKITVDDTSIRFGCGRSYVKLPAHSPDDFTWDIPQKGVKFKIPADMWEKLRAVAECQGVDAHQDWALGVTFSFGVGVLELYATDNFTCAAAEIHCVVPEALQGRSFTVPPRWVLLAVAAKPRRLVFHESAIGLRTVEGTWIYGGLVGDSRPECHARVFDSFNWAGTDRVEITAEILNDLAIAESYYSGEECHAKFLQDKGELALAVEAPTGKLGAVYEQPTEYKGRRTVKFIPSLLRRVAAHSATMSFDLQAFVCVGDGLRFLAPVLHDG